jgi:hypothetical protein
MTCSSQRLRNLNLLTAEIRNRDPATSSRTVRDPLACVSGLAACWRPGCPGSLLRRIARSAGVTFLALLDRQTG